MKKIYLLFLLIWVTVPMTATEQIAERLVMDGKDYGMQYVPFLDLDTALQQNIKIWIDSVGPADCTGLVRGYVGHWSISDDYLYLDSICIHTGWDKDTGQWNWLTYDYRTLSELLSDYCFEGRIRADWVTRDNIRLFADDWALLSYAHIGFSSRFEKEILCSFRSGLLKEVSFKNYVVHKGTQWREQYEGTIANQFPYDQYPQLKGRGTVDFYINDFQLDESGRMCDCQLSLGGTALRDLADADILAEQLTDWVKRKILSVDWQIYQVGDTYSLGRYPHVVLFFNRDILQSQLKRLQ
ncbi:MAG: hypothetical protein J5702_05970 [Bacteroidales bacterium]|nr:hypothetical protein [Bacteroidales bacterium]